MDYDFEGFASALAEDLATVLSEEKTADGLGVAMERAMAAAEAELAAHLDPEEGARIACKAGCGICCRVNVAVLFPEAMAIRDYVRRRFSADEMDRFRGRLADLYREVRWLDDEERLFLHRPCALLDEGGNCTIYPVRPLLCRSVTSTDPEDCRQALTLPALGESRQVLMNLFQKELMEAAFRGMGRALQAVGLDARGVTLTAALKHLSDRPQLAADYLQGGPVPPP